MFPFITFFHYHILVAKRKKKKHYFSSFLHDPETFFFKNERLNQILNRGIHFLKEVPIYITHNINEAWEKYKWYVLQLWTLKFAIDKKNLDILLFTDNLFFSFYKHECLKNLYYYGTVLRTRTFAFVWCKSTQSCIAFDVGHAP